MKNRLSPFAHLISGYKKPKAAAPIASAKTKARGHHDFTHLRGVSMPVAAVAAPSPAKAAPLTAKVVADRLVAVSRGTAVAPMPVQDDSKAKLEAADLAAKVLASTRGAVR